MSSVAKLPVPNLDLRKPVTLRVSRDGLFAAVANTRGQYGFILNLQFGEVVMELDRGGYRPENSHFPVAFFELDGRTLVVHGTDWNRLDASDPATGQLLTSREPPQYERGKTQENYLDYFHGGLTVSPDSEWIADAGWVWSPVGVVRTWSLRHWVLENAWESECGPTLRKLADRFGAWDGPCCWIDNSTLAVWGYGRNEEHLLDAALLFNVATAKNWGRPERWFAGPTGTFVFDEHLFSFSAEYGTAVWDVETGERLLYDPAFCPSTYHHGARCFVTQQENGMLALSRLVGSEAQRAGASRSAQ